MEVFQAPRIGPPPPQNSVILKGGYINTAPGHNKALCFIILSSLLSLIFNAIAACTVLYKYLSKVFVYCVQLTLVRIPGHVGIQGNDLAPRAALEIPLCTINVPPRDLPIKRT